MVAAQKEQHTWVIPEIPGQQTSDEFLVERAQREPRQFDALYTRYVDPVFRYSNRSLTRAAAEDATSITFLKALQSLRRFDPEQGTFRGWLFTIAHNSTVDQLRGRHHADLDSVVVENGGDSVEDQAIAAEQRTRLSEAMRTLPKDQQDVIHLRLASLTSPEIAAVLGKSPGAVRGLQHRAVRELRRELGPQYPEMTDEGDIR